MNVAERHDVSYRIKNARKKPNRCVLFLQSRCRASGSRRYSAAAKKSQRRDHHAASHHQRRHFSHDHRHGDTVGFLEGGNVVVFSSFPAAGKAIFYCCVTLKKTRELGKNMGRKEASGIFLKATRATACVPKIANPLNVSWLLQHRKSSPTVTKI